MIGIFDSGSGGLTVLRALKTAMPAQDFIYLGDHRNAPYGHRSNEDIVRLTTDAIDFLMQRGCRLVVLACNTAAAVALRFVQQNWLPAHYPDRRVLGVLVPMVEAVTGVPWHIQEPLPASHRDNRTLALFATRKTVESHAYTDELTKRTPNIKLVAKACPGLVDAIEGGAGRGPLTGLINGYVSEIIHSMGNKRPDAAILGCTHFPIVEQYFAAALGPNVPIYSQPEIVAESLGDYLSHHPEFACHGTGQLELLTSGDAYGEWLPDDIGAFASLRP